MNSPKPLGLYDEVVTRGVKEELQRLPELDPRLDQLDESEAHLYLGQHIHRLLQSAFRAYPGNERLERQIALSSRILELLQDELPDAFSSKDHPTEQLLTAILRKPVSSLDPQQDLPRPGVPLSQSELLVNARGEYRIGHELLREIPSADRIDLLCSFIKWSGLRVLAGALEPFLAEGKPLRVITTVYMGATDRRALDWLVARGAQVRVSYDTRRTRLHAKAWLFHRSSGYSTAYIGSSNLSAAAQSDGLEWNVRVSAIDSPRVLNKFEATFDTYWPDTEFVPYYGTEEDRRKFNLALNPEGDEPGTITFFDIAPYPFQQEILERLEVERSVHNRTANLVVAATGTGKTVVAALDYRRLLEQYGSLKLLFVAHRKEILTQSRNVFRQVLRDGNFGELLVDGEQPEHGDHVFASIQSLSRIDLTTVDPGAFDVLIIDEFHHAAAKTYDQLLSHLKPAILLGLTATPERTDEQDILHWFGGHVAAELRLWDAIDRGLLAPFQYFGVHDNTDLLRLVWSRGRYDDGKLEQLYTANDFRVNLILKAIENKLPDPRGMRAVGFCVGVGHARFMADRFNAAGIPSLSLTGKSSSEERVAAIQQLRQGAVNVLFTVDLFNEGIDIPEIDTVLFLRPTESATVFLQQLGRGLRLHARKECLTVLDSSAGRIASFGLITD